jgi:hypothetical protein
MVIARAFDIVGTVVVDHPARGYADFHITYRRR